MMADGFGPLPSITQPIEFAFRNHKTMLGQKLPRLFFVEISTSHLYFLQAAITAANTTPKYWIVCGTQLPK
jgi:hypothetical protein